jgi:hypothetical protein
VKSSERLSPLVTVLVLIGSLATMGILRGELVERFQRLKARSDVYALPSPEQLVVASLGYRSALADILYVDTVISYGIHAQEKRRFEYAANYLDAVMTLDPRFRSPYMFADTLLTMQAAPTRREDYLNARALLERGMQAFPQDAELWLNAGQFMAYLAAPYLGDKELEEQWRLDGARVLAKACEFVSSNENIPFHCITAAALFSKAGQREASIRFLERVLAVSDNEEIRSIATGYLQRISGEEQREKVELRHRRFRESWGADLRFVSRDLLLVLGPRFDSARCAGAQASGRSECVTSWREWSALLNPREAP